MKHIIFLAASLLATSACAEAYKPDAGPYQIEISDNVTLPAEGRDLTVRVAYPDAGGRFPVVVLSHGGGCLAVRSRCP